LTTLCTFQSLSRACSLILYTISTPHIQVPASDNRQRTFARFTNQRLRTKRRSTRDQKPTEPLQPYTALSRAAKVRHSIARTSRPAPRITLPPRPQLTFFSFPRIVLPVRLMDAMSTRFQKFGFGSKRKSNVQTAIVATNGTPATTPPPNSSTTSLPQSSMNPQPNGLGRPPSYSNYNAGRPQSPMPPQNQQVAAHHPPPIDTSQRYPGSNPTMGAPQPPGYGGAYGQQPAPVPQPLGQYGSMRPVAEAPGEARNKAQLIVGIDFVSQTFAYQPKIIFHRLTCAGNHIFWRCIRLRNQHRGQRRYHH
jgi:hypothetical protein